MEDVHGKLLRRQVLGCPLYMGKSRIHPHRTKFLPFTIFILSWAFLLKRWSIKGLGNGQEVVNFFFLDTLDSVSTLLSRRF